jgi:hypothetical protein
MDIYGPGVMHYPVIADLDVKNTKVTESVNGPSKDLEKLKVEAVNKAVKTAAADLLVEPVYEVEGTGRNVVVTVTGFPATYKNFRPAAETDLPMMEASLLHKAETAEATETPSKKKFPTAGIVGILVLVGTVVALIVAI